MRRPILVCTCLSSLALCATVDEGVAEPTVESLSEQPLTPPPGGAPPPGTPVGLAEIRSVFGLNTLSAPPNVAAQAVVPGVVYTLRAPTPVGQEDRYQLDFNAAFSRALGLGMQQLADQVAVDDFLDTSFGFGQTHAPAAFPPIAPQFEADIGRMRTPVLVFPERNVIVAYVQRRTKALRLCRPGSAVTACAGQPASTTTLVMKSTVDPNGSSGWLLLIRGASITDAYERYRAVLNQAGFYVKRPHPKAFGVAWETWSEYGCTATYANVKAAYDQYRADGITPSVVTIGSGFWQELSGTSRCQNGTNPAMEVLAQSPNFKSGTQSLDTLASYLNPASTYLMLGMRHNVIQGYAASYEAKFEANGFTCAGRSSPLANGAVYRGNVLSDNGRLLEVRDACVMSRAVDLFRGAYGTGFRGIKEDEMFFTDQAAASAAGIPSTAPNLFDGFAAETYDDWTRKFGGDLVIWGRNDFFGVGSDLQNSEGWLGRGVRPDGSTRPFDRYAFRYIMDSMLTQVVSGYPHPNMELPFDWNGSAMVVYQGQVVTPTELLRAYALTTFLPGATQSAGYWHLTAGSPERSSIVSFGQIRSRLRQYAYDQAMAFYETGVPTLMQPLFMRFPNEAMAHDVYRRSTGTPESFPRDSFMMGNALLVRPLFQDSATASVYFPSGRWRPYLRQGPNTTIVGPTTASYTLRDTKDYPVFLREGELIVIGKTAQAPDQLKAMVFLETTSVSVTYRLHAQATSGLVAVTRLQAKLDSDGKVYLVNLENGRRALMTANTYSKGFVEADVALVL